MYYMDFTGLWRYTELPTSMNKLAKESCKLMLIARFMKIIFCSNDV